MLHLRRFTLGRDVGCDVGVLREDAKAESSCFDEDGGGGSRCCGDTVGDGGEEAKKDDDGGGGGGGEKDEAGCADGEPSVSSCDSFRLARLKCCLGVLEK